MKIFIFAFLGLATLVTTSQGAALTLDPSGTDSGDCVSSSCFTLCYALSQVEANVTNSLTLGAGTYDYSGPEARCTVLSPTGNLTISGAGSTETILDYGYSAWFNESTYSPLNVQRTTAGDIHLQLSGLEFKNYHATSGRISVITIAGDVLVSDVSFRNCAVAQEPYLVGVTVVAEDVMLTNYTSASSTAIVITASVTGNLTMTGISASDVRSVSTLISAAAGDDLIVTDVTVSDSEGSLELGCSGTCDTADVSDVSMTNMQGGNDGVDVEGSFDTVIIDRVTADGGDMGYVIQVDTSNTLSISNCVVENMSVDSAVMIDSGDNMEMSDLTVRNVSSSGGDTVGAYMELDGNVVVTGCTFEDLMLDSAGEAVAMYLGYIGGDTTISGCTFSELHSIGSGGVGAVLIEESEGAVEVTDCVFEHCSSPSDVGGLYIDVAESVVLSDLSFSDIFSDGDTGALHVYDVSEGVLLEGSSFVDCNATNGAGAVYMDSVVEVIVVEDTEFERCTSSSDNAGAAELGSDSDVNITDVTVSDCWGGYYGGFYISENDANLHNVHMDNIGVGSTNYGAFLEGQDFHIWDSSFSGAYGLNVSNGGDELADAWTDIDGFYVDGFYLYNTVIYDNYVEIVIDAQGGVLSLNDGSAVYGNAGSIWVENDDGIVSDGTGMVFNNGDALNVSQIVCEDLLDDVPCFECGSCIGPGATCFLSGMDNTTFVANDNGCVCADGVEGDACDSCSDEELVYSGYFFDGECVEPDGGNEDEEDGEDGAGMVLAPTLAMTCMFALLSLVL